MPSVAILAALDQELAPLRRAPFAPRVRFLRTGIGPAKAAAATRGCTDATLILSTGCCGGLVPGAAAGMLAVPEEVLRLDRDGTVSHAPPPDRALAARARALAEQLGLHASARPLVTVSEALYTPQSKQACHARTGAVVVDMETAAIAAVAAERGVPYLSLRVVLDAADETLPPVPRLRDASGKLSPRKLLAAVRRPADLLSLAALAFRLRSVSDDLVRVVGPLLEEILPPG